MIKQLNHIGNGSGYDDMLHFSLAEKASVHNILTTNYIHNSLTCSLSKSGLTGAFRAYAQLKIFKTSNLFVVYIINY